MRWWIRGPLVLACAVAGGCITDFKHPLGPVAESFIDPHLLGAWSCASEDDPEPGVVTILGFDSRQYYLQMSGQGDAEPSHSRAVATRVEDTTFLSIHELGHADDEDWTFMQYTLPDASHLKLRLVDPSRFEEVVDDSAALRQRLAERLQDPETFAGELACTRKSPAVPPSGPSPAP